MLNCSGAVSIDCRKLAGSCEDAPDRCDARRMSDSALSQNGMAGAGGPEELSVV